MENMSSDIEKRKNVVEKNKKEMPHRRIVALIAAIIMVVGIAVSFAVGFTIGQGSASDGASYSSQPAEDGLKIISTTENGEWIVLNTSYASIRYPFAFSDVIEVECYNSGSSSQLRFYAKTEGEKILNYTIHFNGDVGTVFGTLKIKEKIPVSVVFEEAPEGLSKDWLTTFSAVQETFNDVMKSLEENNGFSVVV